MPILPYNYNGPIWTTRLYTLFHLKLIIPKQNKFIYHSSVWVHFIAICDVTGQNQVLVANCHLP